MSIDELVNYTWDEDLSGEENEALRRKEYEKTETTCAEMLKQLFIRLDYKKLIEDWTPENKKRMELLMNSELLRRDVVSGKNEDLKDLCNCAISNADTDAFFDNLETITSCGL